MKVSKTKEASWKILANTLNSKAIRKIIAEAKYHSGLFVINPRKQKILVPRKKAVKSLIRVFFSTGSLIINPKEDAAASGLKIQLRAIKAKKMAGIKGAYDKTFIN